MSDLLRERFEAWVKSWGGDITPADGPICAHFADESVDLAWDAWQAALAAVPPPPDRNDLLGGQGGRTADPPATQRQTEVAEQKEAVPPTGPLAQAVGLKCAACFDFGCELCRTGSRA